MISTAAILIPLVALFLLGIKMTTDLIRDWQRKKAQSNYAQERRWRQSDRYYSPLRIDINAFVAGLKNLARSARKAAVTRGEHSLESYDSEHRPRFKNGGVS